MIKPLLKPSEVAALLRVTTDTVYNWVTAGKLESVRIPGGHIRIPKASIKKYLPETP